MCAKKTDYNASDITLTEGLPQVRETPSLLIGAADSYGQFHQTKEIIDNSIDEIDRPDIGNQEGYLKVWMFQNKKEGKYQLALLDSGRGIPAEKLKEVCTKLGASAKRGAKSSAYFASSGQFGYGLKAAAALSTKFRAMTFRDNIGELLIEDCEIVKNEITKIQSNRSGTLIVFEPSPEVFKDTIPEFIATGYNQIVELLTKFSIFITHVEFSFQISNKLLPNEIWEMYPEKVREYLESEHNEYITVFKNDKDEPVDNLVVNCLQINSPIIWNMNIFKQVSAEDPLGFDLKLYLTKRMKHSGNILSMVNNVPIKRNMDSSHVIGMYNALKSRLADYIEDKERRVFFLKDYQFPLYVALSVKYKGAELYGSTKEAFIDKNFMTKYLEDLVLKFDEIPEANWKVMYDLLIDDIEYKFDVAFNRPLKTSNDNKIILELNFPKNYAMVNEPNSTRAELFIVEGLSAMNSSSEREAHQAMYCMRGKLLNILKTSDKKTAISKMIKNLIFQDLIRIIGVGPHDKDLSKMKFSIVFIMTDADPDGYHIQNIVMGGMYTINPLILENGRFHIITPPLYKLIIGGKKGISVYLKDKKTLDDFFIYKIYSNCFNVFVKTPATNGEYQLLKGEVLREFCYIVNRIGEAIDDISNRLSVPPDVLERLLNITGYINPGNVDIEKVREVFEGRRVVMEGDDTLIVSIEDEDIIISLHDLNKLFYEKVLPTLNRIGWKKIEIYITTLTSDIYQKSKMSIVQLYYLFGRIAEITKIKRYKGLGELGSSIYETCLCPRTRASIKILNIGDAQRLFDILGKDTSIRRELLADSGATHTSVI